jgi:hypothetical protein
VPDETICPVRWSPNIYCRTNSNPACSRGVFGSNHAGTSSNPSGLDRYLDGEIDGYTRQQCGDQDRQLDNPEQRCDQCDPDWEAAESVIAVCSICCC